MFCHCFFILCCFDVANLFALQDCNAKKTIYIVAILDCQVEVQEQIHFIETFEEYMRNNTKEGVSIHSRLTKMPNNKCTKKADRVFFQRKYDKLPPDFIGIVDAKPWDTDLEFKCSTMVIPFIFVYNITYNSNKINQRINDRAEHENEKKIHNRFFIIRSFENPKYVYSSKDFINFTSSFKDLNIKHIFHKICDLDIENSTLSYTRRSYIQTDYRIVNQLSGTSFKDAFCFCSGTHKMKLISLESYEEFVDIIQYLAEKLLQNDTINTNLYLGFNCRGFLEWANNNPYFYSYPSQSLNNKCPCFYINLSAHTNSILSQDKNLYNLGRYMVEIDCEKPLQHSVVVCEGKNVISEMNVKRLYTQSITVSGVEFLSDHQIINNFDIFKRENYFTSRFTYICDVNNQTTGNVLGKYLCSNYLNKQTINNTKNNFITLLYDEIDSFYYMFRKLDISNCERYTECQKIMYSKTKIDDDVCHTYVYIFCGDDRNNKILNDTCSIREVPLKYSFEYVQCESDANKYSLRCLKADTDQCKDNSHLHNCENFICPQPFVKCFNSYCISTSMINDNNHDCPHGEDESLGLYSVNRNGLNIGIGSFIMVLSDICHRSKSFDNFLPSFGNSTQNVCYSVCPNNYKCLSSKHKESFHNKTIMQIYTFQMTMGLSRISDVVIPDNTIVQHSHLFSIVSFTCSKCAFKNFDFEFQYWKFEDLFILDISYNNLNHSNYLKYVETFLQLKLLNLSHNENLIIGNSFNFPRSLEIIDLSNTKIQVLESQVFGNFIHLKHLNLSHTLIIQFKDMGLPEYFTLDTLYIQDIEIQHIDTNFFRGLTINFELMASDYVICCPQILNTNISVDKCHARINIVSSCKDLVGDTFKRIVIWIVGLLTIVGNGIVLVYRIGWNREIFKKAYGIFITGLAISDFIMGVYLMIIACVDVYYKDVYILDDFKWRNGFLCNLCGFLSTLSSETSTFFICLITLDRFLCITYPFGEHRFSKTDKLLSFTLVWFVGFVLALIPIVLSDWEIYSSNGLCLALPLSPTQNKGWIFSFVVFVGLNFILFLIIAFGQLTIFISLMKVKKSIPSIRRNIQRRSEDLSVAKKLAFVAFTDFCCWYPVGILGFLSLNGYIFNREVYAWIAVFVLPINSALNPIIYTIPTVYSKCRS